MGNYKHFGIAKYIVQQVISDIFGTGRLKPGYKGSHSYELKHELYFVSLGESLETVRKRTMVRFCFTQVIRALVHWMIMMKSGLEITGLKQN